ncbi:MAG: preprotein translocase subunit YajC [Phycisphaerales bacterium]|nr:preprotein translocase subunit YajC [Planctomycetota bacterium]
MQTQFAYNLVLAQAGVNAGAPATTAPAGNSNQALVPLGIPTASKPAPGESQALQSATPGTPARPSGPMDSMLVFLLPLCGIMLFVIWNGNRSEKKKRAELNSSVKKGDTVQMIGGIIGVVSELRDDEIVLKMEEGRIRFARSAVQAVLKNTRDAKSDTTVEPKLASANAGAR